MKDLAFRLKILIPQVWRNIYGIVKERKQLKQLATVNIDTQNLRSFSKEALGEAMDSHEISATWDELWELRDSLNIPQLTLGVNPGDQRAIYHLVKALGCQRILEVGTHIGSSTAHLGLALKKQQAPKLVTIDIEDVNNPKSNKWLDRNKHLFPKELIAKVNCGNFVEFVVGNSLDFMQDCQEKFDLIFLDGDHRAFTVYQEIPLALNLLNPGGLIMLHDYFPGNKPLWSNSSITPGTYLATQRLRSENTQLKVLPFSSLPWDTKLNSRVSSLALVTT